MDPMLSSTPFQNGNAGSGDAASKGKPKGLIEKMYQKKSQLEHILLRPDTYIGSVEKVTEMMWVYDQISESMVQREITYVPGLYKIFDEILVNAADNKQRDEKMNCIKINIDPEENVISIWNNGKGIPVVEHKDEKMYVPTMIFGHLLTSSNYNDEEEKVTGGRNGYGAKLCNIFSNKFVVETASKEYKRKFKQTWTTNMTKTTNPAVKDSSEDYTKITFSPDLAKFRMEKLDKDIVDLFSRRAFDVAASTRDVKVFLNDKRVPVKNFKDYCELYLKDTEMEEKPKIIYESPNPRWEVAVTISDTGFKQVSFVNSIATTKGGRHVDYITDMLVKSLGDAIKKKDKNLNIKPFQIKNHLWVFINCLVVNPTFDSQTKENMTLQAKNFGSKCTFSDKFFQQLVKSGNGSIIDAVKIWAQFKQKTELEKKGGKKQSKLKGIAKLEDANDAGTKNSISCTLILTEGDSAKTLAVSGLGVIGRDRYGVFPLRGKLLNVREATHRQIMDNAEINNLVKIVGLQYKKKYETVEDLKTLRYGKLMIMTDQDQDGSHIKGLIINFIHHNWPSLLKMEFLEEFITPIIKAKRADEELSFFSIPEFVEWQNATPNHDKYEIKYYKGLGTSTSSEAKEYFRNMDRHRIVFKYRNQDDDSHITMAFSKKMIDARKEWLTNWMAESKRRKEMGLGDDYLYAKDTRSVTYKDFINKELVLFSNMDNERSIPNMMDGLKPGSRKVIYTCLLRNDKKEVKVAQLAGSVAEKSAYHHGEQSLMSTIINLAQNFVGSNNMNMLQPIGQFGTRLQGGKDAASPRYIFTKLSPLARMIFHPHDDPLLTYLRDDNKRVEPIWYVPVIPMVLVNGAEGIGTGWMTKIPNHNPREIIQNLYRMIRGEEPVPMKPWYKNFRGEIEKLGENRFVTNGEIGIVSDEKLEITELPIGTWTQTYKESVLEPALNGPDKDKEKEKGKEKEKVPALITDYKEYNTDTTVKFQVFMAKDKLKKAELEGLHKVFKLQNVLTVTSMCAFDKDSVLRRYDSAIQILREFFDVRLEFYGKRKNYLVGMLEAESLKLKNQARFILEKCDGDLKIENKKKKDMIAELVKKAYDSDPVSTWKKKVALDVDPDEDTAPETEDESQSEVIEKPDENADYDYLLGMKLWSLTLEKKNALLKQRDEKIAELNALTKRSPKDLWIEDLDTLSAKLDEVEEEERKVEAGIKPGKNKGSTKEKGGSKKKIHLSSDVLPSPHAIRVIPKYDEMLKKAEKAEAAKENKGKRAKKKEEQLADYADGELNGDSQSPVEKLEKAKGKKKDPAAPKETKTKKMTSPKKKKTFSFSDDDEVELDSDSSDFDFEKPEMKTPVRTTSRRAAANIKFNFGDDDEKSESDDDDRDNESIKESGPSIQGKESESDNDSPVKMKKTTVATIESDSNSDSIIDDLISDESDYDTQKKKKASAKKFPANTEKVSKAATSKKKEAESKPKAKKESVKKSKPVPKKKILDSEDSDDDFRTLMSDDDKPKTSGKRKMSSDSDLDDFVKPKKTTNDVEISSDAMFDSLLNDSPPKRSAATKKPRNNYSFIDSNSDGEDSDGSDYKPSPKKKGKAKR